MKQARVFFLIVAAAFLLSGQTLAQKKDRKITISGFVVDQTQAPVVNAVVMVDGISTPVLTNKNGYYKIKVRPVNMKLGIFTTTNGTLEETINGRERINFQFAGTVPVQQVSNAAPDPGDEEVNVGYQKVKKKNLTTSVGKIDGRQSKYASYSSIYEMLKGEIPGVVVTGNSVYIRNPSSINASNEPLFVVDGVPAASIDGIQPQMVKSIHVLKGSDASIYGVRGANGVILIDLLTGKDR
jgi:TonB-dependent SusC/RagA subfamily outer membrane receptor